MSMPRIVSKSVYSKRACFPHLACRCPTHITALTSLFSPSQNVAHACLRARRRGCRSDAPAAWRSGELVSPGDQTLLRCGFRSHRAALFLQAHIKDTGGRTALSYAKMNNHKACEDLLPADAPLGRMSATEPSGTSGAGMTGDTEVRHVMFHLFSCHKYRQS